jgi:hypothetical protein
MHRSKLPARISYTAYVGDGIRRVLGVCHFGILDL